MGRVEVCKIILRTNFAKDKNPQDIHGITPLHKAAEYGFLEICKMILDVVMDKNPQDFCGVTPLHEAALMKRIEIFKLILSMSKDKNPKDFKGRACCY